MSSFHSLYSPVSLFLGYLAGRINSQTLGAFLFLLSIRQGSPGVPSFLYRVNLTTPGYDWYVTWGYSGYLVTRADQSDFKTG